MPPVFRLDLLGDPLFTGPDGPVQGRAAHKRRVALLAVLAMARGRPVGRERLLGLLWPELDGDAARHNLSESLYVLRKELGEGAIVPASAGDVALDRGVVESDVALFQELLDAGEVEEAVRLYRGPLLDGFYVADAPEFERWADGERERLARAYSRALESLAEAAEAEGSALRAVDCWRRLAGHDPFSSRTALRLVRALDAAGERPTALRAAASHVVLLREELGVEPDPDFQSFVARLRAEPAREAAPHPALPRAAVPAAVSLEPPVFAPLPLEPPVVAVPPEVPERDADDVVATVPPSPTAAPRDPAGAAVAGRDGNGVRAAPRVRPARRRAGHDAIYYGAIAGVLMGMMLAVLTVWAAERRAAPAAPGYDPRRIAVLYFDDLSPGRELDYLAAGLTERLIHELSQVAALDVVSRGGVKPYRDGQVPFDSMVARLKVGSVVEGSLQRSGDSVWVTVDLVDATSQTHLQSREIGRPLGDVVALERAVAAEVAAALRQRVGQEVRLREASGETKSPGALQAVLQAEQLRRDARELASTRDTLDTGSGMLLLLRADSLLAGAQAADAGWGEPVLLHGWVDAERARLVRGAARDALLRSAQARASSVLARAPAAPGEALELRGAVLYRRAMGNQDTTLRRAQLDSAEHDLRAAVAAEPSRAGAWSVLSQLVRVRGRLAESELAARRALAEDAFMDDAADIRSRLFYSALSRGDFPRAHDDCDRGRAQFPSDYRFTECALTLLRNDRSRPADPAAAWRLVAELDRLDPPARARAQERLYSPIYRRMLAAAVLARSGYADSARAMTARARREAGSNPDLQNSLDYDEAWMHLMLGDTAAARALLARMVRSRPEQREYLARDPMARSLGRLP